LNSSTYQTGKVKASAIAAFLGEMRRLWMIIDGRCKKVTKTAPSQRFNTGSGAI
jgi:hypothetical protein